MLAAQFRALFADPHGTPALVRRLLSEYGGSFWRQYTKVFVLMGISAGCTALSAYLIGQTINVAYLNRNVAGVLAIGGVIVVLFAVKGVSTYGHALLLSRISNSHQTIVTTTDIHRFDQDFVRQANIYNVSGGIVNKIEA